MYRKPLDDVCALLQVDNTGGVTEDTMETYREIAENWNLWTEYIDPGATMTEEEWKEMDLDERIALIVDCFGPEAKNATGWVAANYTQTDIWDGTCGPLRATAEEAKADATSGGYDGVRYVGDDGYLYVDPPEADNAD